MLIVGFSLAAVTSIPGDAAAPMTGPLNGKNEGRPRFHLETNLNVKIAGIDINGLRYQQTMRTASVERGLLSLSTYKSRVSLFTLFPFHLPRRKIARSIL